MNLDRFDTRDQLRHLRTADRGAGGNQPARRVRVQTTTGRRSGGLPASARKDRGIPGRHATPTTGPHGGRDPFVPNRSGIALAPAPVGDIVPDPLRSREALERFPLDSLAMVGTLARGDIIRALIATSDRTLFQVGVGDYIGTHNGRITRITEERIELTKIIPEGSAWRERQATFTLRVTIHE